MEEDRKEGRFFEHFSHGHLLVLGDLPLQENATCHGCNTIALSGISCYLCRKCPFFLHQVCYSMPMIVHHPVDPHPLSLSSMHQSPTTSADCKACGETITAFYYACTKCSSHYHILCLALPLSVRVPSHPHTLTLEFAPPYDFQCDLCARPSSASGWLYHCGICEFDVHISCAITNRGAQFLHEPVESHHSRGHELMELLSRGINGGRDIHNVDDSATPSYQFSDACFSIDFAKSLLGDDEETKTTTGNVNLQKPEPAGVADDQASVQRPSIDSEGESSKRALINLKVSSPINPRVWMDLDPESRKEFKITPNSQNVKAKRTCCW